MEGYFFRFWLLGFLASRLLGFLASQLLGFSASCWFMRKAQTHPLHSQFLSGRWRCFAAFRWFTHQILCFPVPLRAFWLLNPLIGFWFWLNASSASPVPLRPVFIICTYVCCMYVCNLCNLFMRVRIYVCLYVCTSSNIIGEATRQPPRCFLYSIVITFSSITPLLFRFFLQRFSCTPI